MEMRQVFGQQLEKLMQENKKIVVLDADLGKSNGTFPLRKVFPDRALDVGIAEANMTGMAAGMTSFGLIPFVCTFAPFMSRRVADQVAVSVAFANRNVKMVGTDPGLLAEKNGATHMSFDDVGIMTSIPGIVVVEPVDTVQLEQVIPAIVEYEGPVYLRLCRKTAEPVFEKDTYRFNLFGADTIKEGRDVTIFATGMMVAESMKAVEALKSQGIDAELINIHTIKPLDIETVARSAAKTGAVVVAENHNVYGGLFSAVCEVLARVYPVPAEPVAIKDRHGEVGAAPYLKKVLGLTSDEVVQAAVRAIERKNALKSVR